MSADESQIVVPPSFIALFVEPGRVKPNVSIGEIRERYELCEDLATMLVDTAQTQLWELGITEADVLQRIERGVSGSDLALVPNEVVWVVRRLAELLGWNDHLPDDLPGGQA